MGCSKQQVEPAITSIEGNWTFTTTGASGQFTVGDISGFKGVTSGKFSVTSGTGQVYDRVVVTQSLIEPVYKIRLISDHNTDSALELEGVTVATNFGAMQATSIHTSGPSLPQFEQKTTVTIRRVP